MEFRIIPGGPNAGAEGKRHHPAHRALHILRSNPAFLAQDTKTGRRYGLADLEDLLGEPRTRAGDDA